MFPSVYFHVWPSLYLHSGKCLLQSCGSGSRRIRNFLARSVSDLAFMTRKSVPIIFAQFSSKQSDQSLITNIFTQKISKMQCCGSGSGIRCLFDPCNPGCSFRIQDPDPDFLPSRIPDSQSLETIFERLKYLNSLMRIRDPVPGWKKFGSGIRNGKKPDLGSGIRKNILDPQHC